MLSSPRLRLYRIIRPSLVLSQSFADRLWCGQNREVVDNGRSQDQFGPEGPEVSTSAAWRSPAVRDQTKGRRVAGDPNLKLEAPHGTDSSQTQRWRKADANFSSLSGSAPFRAGGAVQGRALTRQVEPRPRPQPNGRICPLSDLADRRGHRPSWV